VSILCYGAVNPDLVHRVDRLPEPGDDVQSRSSSWLYGGKATNVAAALAAWDEEPVLMGLVLGEDHLGDLLVAALRRARVDPSWLARDTNQTTRHCVVLVDPRGERTIVSTGYEGARWQQVSSDIWERTEVLVVDDLAGSAAAGVASEARRRGVSVVWLDGDARKVTSGDLVVWSRHEHGTGEAVDLAGRGVRVVLTAGPDPTSVWWDGASFTVAPPPVRAVDATGSGDVVAAGCAYGLVQGWEPVRLVRWAVAAGAALCARGRAAGMPTVDEVAALAGGG